ncbi:phosphatidylserine/phosphatidylglycerophosphate/cardiolipin synthase family protein [Candidatus Gracilibacteria bacterium]|nr:phosphatidylserine/phosphatidylglycerophosphate/cardiolipin synthase family protein [Candidatus Gracilibacteria bacterium]
MVNYEKNITKLIIDGENATSEIINCIKEAKKTIRIRMFMWRDDNSGRKILDILEEKLKSNPEIKVFIEKDSFGSLVYNFQKWISFGKLGGDIFSSEKGQNFIKNNKNLVFSFVGSRSILFFKYLKENDHSKIFLFDENTVNSIVIIGGMNIADEYLTAQNSESSNVGGWHDYMVKLEGKIANKFSSHISKHSKKGLRKKILSGIEILSSIRNKRTLRSEILIQLYKAKKSIIIEHGYITDNLTIRKLRKISQKGINIKIILPNVSDGVYHANMHSIYKILKPTLLTHKITPNIEVYLYKGMIHAKVMVIDDEVSIIGSANLTNGSFDILKETNAIFRQKDGVTKELLTQLNLDLKNCEKITLENIPKYNKFLAKIQKFFI